MLVLLMRKIYELCRSEYYILASCCTLDSTDKHYKMSQTVFCAAIIIIFITWSSSSFTHTTCFGFHRAIIGCVYSRNMSHCICCDALLRYIAKNIQVEYPIIPRNILITY
jgi:hypothetical protein